MKIRFKLSCFFILTVCCFSFLTRANTPPEQTNEDTPFRLGIIGLVHDHVHWIFNRNKKDIIIVGIVETNPIAISKFQKRYKVPDSLFFDSYEALYNKAKPEAVSAFNPTNKHLEVISFLDVANLWGVDDTSLDDGSKIRSAIGIGIDWFTPVGPLNFSFSHPISKSATDLTETFRFNLGTTF